MNKTYLLPLITILIISVSSFKKASEIPYEEKTESIEEKMVKAMEWQEAHPIYAHAPTDWTNGAYYTGVVRAHQATKNQLFLAALKTMGYQNEWKTAGREHHADDIAICYSYLYVNSTRKDLVDFEPTDAFIQNHLYKPHPWKEGIKDRDEQTLWWWCDALFMAPPVLASYSKLKNDTTYLDEMHKYYKETFDLLYDKEEHLFARDVRFLWKGEGKDRKEKNGNKIFWSRGNGWVIGGLALVLDDMPKNYKHYDFYVNLYKEMAEKIKDIQPEDGLWKVSLLAPEAYNHGEVSGSGFYTFALAWGINNGILDKATYTPVVEKAWKALANCQKENGMVGWVQNIGYDPQPANPNSWQNYGTGAFLLAGSELLKLK